MKELTLYITEDLADRIEEYFCEVGQNNWMIYADEIKNDHRLVGFFSSDSEMNSCLNELIEEFDLPKEDHEYQLRELEDQDWKESYKKHFTAWSQGNLHWVPNWEKETYPLPEGHKMLLIDPGMAFGTGNHPTTRLCVEAILEFKEKWGEDYSAKNVTDAGCGSGILALSAALLGFQNIFAFDNDEDAIRISLENAGFNLLDNKVDFQATDLNCLNGRAPSDLLIANIQSSVLIPFSTPILENLTKDSTLCLSGILAKEEEKILEHYIPELKKRNLPSDPVVRRMDEWISVTFG